MDSAGWEPLLGKVVVVDTDSMFVYLGTLDRVEDHFVVLKGMMKVVLFDTREESPTHGVINEFFMGEHNPILLQIPTWVCHGIKCIGEQEAILLNLPTEPFRYDEPDEYRIAPHDPAIPYDWSRQDR